MPNYAVWADPKISKKKKAEFNIYQSSLNSLLHEDYWVLHGWHKPLTQQNYGIFAFQIKGVGSLAK